ncbi:class I SAM-dependent methyltransferase [Streptomyces calidiresistens]|uniref:Class I SAM-dependent methyltransferase n=1 Tax=Streptomyces calidiresistens TaxID=1485586 RepID=A0A7W3T569_9ACTN|nr:class I SAM-dependent methyltransferase [Streptomyces calidiresistens]MBB0230986.1 hypothetical protein [Streptomyces calidiresistens]
MINPTPVLDWRPGHRQPGMVELTACRHLHNLATGVPADHAIVELGSYRGRSTGWLLLGAHRGHHAHVHAVDARDQRTDETYEGSFERFTGAHPDFARHMQRIGATDRELTVHLDYAHHIAHRWTGPPVGLLWHDAGHGADEVERDLLAWLPLMAPGATIVVHDAANPHWGVVEGARRALEHAPGWMWNQRTLTTWPRRRNRRGTLTVHHRPHTGGGR